MGMILLHLKKKNLSLDIVEQHVIHSWTNIRTKQAQTIK